ncbi:hypothetical protein ACH5RR_024307 [Cinchona calisaya]|uniref:Uncharacterized protein n=1 Tax=Cinchona calisaya TaxID=153742 RepID=A0ABD2YZQ5_9GENT
MSSSLTEIVLSYSYLVQDPMPTLARFPNLWILVLHNRAFLGKQMVCSACGFCQLRHLRLLKLHELQTLIVEGGAMPKLLSLKIEGCNKLEGLPMLGKGIVRYQ